jgi:23S rRNA pseudouridine2605 synthase
LLEGLLLDYSRRQGHGDEDEDHTDHHEVSGDDDTPIYPAKLERIERREGEEGEGANRWYHVVIKEGRNREVRRLFEAVGITVSRLIRTRFGDIALPPRLKRGMMYELTPEEVRRVLKTRGMDELADAPDESEGRRGRRSRGKPGHDERGLRPQRPDRGPRPPRPSRPPRNGQGQQVGAFTDPDGQPFDNAGNVMPGQESRDPAKRRNRRRKRGRGKPLQEGQASIQSGSAEGASGEGVAAPGGEGNSAPRDPSQRRKRPRRNFRKRNRREGGSNNGGGTAPPGTDGQADAGNE